jgi:hypothetical protein
MALFRTFHVNLFLGAVVIDVVVDVAVLASLYFGLCRDAATAVTALHPYHRKQRATMCSMFS